jgi:predicted dehydrogenase
MVRIGIVGIGFMGRIHYLAAKRLTDARVVAVCSRDRKKLAGDWTATRGNFGPEPGRVDLTGVKTYADFGAMLADPDIDLIDVCNPTHLHPETAIAALKAGKHVLVEKAIALTPGDADAMLAAAQSTGKLLMVAHVLPFFPEFRYATEAVRSGSYGKLLGAHFTRVISKPDWSAEIADAGKTGGPAVDLHIHDTHYIGLLCGVPRGVFSTGLTDDAGAVPYLTTQYLYGPGGPSVSCSSGAIAMPGRPFIHGFEVYLEKATLSHDSRATPLTVYPADGQVSHPKFEGDGDPIASFAEEIKAAADGVRTGREPALLSGKLARDALVMCLAECESVRTGRTIAMN